MAAPTALRKPDALRPGDKIRIVTPASPLSREKMDFAIELLEGEGYVVELGEHALDAYYYLAGQDRDRASDLMAAFEDPDVKAVLCARGGYGCARLMPYLDFDRMAASRKLFLGFSDITTLHIALNRRGLPTVHSPMPITLSAPREPWVIESFKRMFRGDVTVPEGAPRAETVVGGVVEAEVTGGCLCLIGDSIGTPEPFDATGKIAVLEDVDEMPHRVDAMLTHMLNAGVIQKAAGIVVGEMTRTDEKTDEGIGGLPWKEIVRDRLGGLGIPMVWDFPFGHAAQMLSVPFGVRARLDADAGTLTFLESHCS
ncbi:MAG: LD-carboxypeptidase [Fimbriimonadaceae bacterium]